MTAAVVGLLIRRQRDLVRRSQMSLAHEIGVSPRHLSFVELGKSRPSPKLLLAIAEHLDVPLRERNDWLLAAGYAPHYPETPLAGPRLARVRESLQALLDAHEPYPGVVVDRRWSVQLTNAAAARFSAGIPEGVRGSPTNIFRVSLHPDGLGGRTHNFAEWSTYLLRQLDRAVTQTQDVELAALAAEIATWPSIPDRRSWTRLLPVDQLNPVMPWRLRLDGEDLSLFTTMSTFGTPQDITLSELTVELFFPSDDITEAYLRRAPSSR
ncbi:helix-turn-helix domain-containing protein [Pseudonocardia spinosispora]|uniref:helix-turn-helix domain-containing protein n=1 Tax=Pseudonocardia spinosispora TaxID=103441 RepID=UPI00048E73BF|nr:helix-turn-helix domain-containing protein [Pseudonocardia spinosispora]